jgi:acetyl esterase/lipase
MVNLASLRRLYSFKNDTRADKYPILNHRSFDAQKATIIALRLDVLPGATVDRLCFKVEHNPGAAVTHAIYSGNAANIPNHPHPGNARDALHTKEYEMTISTEAPQTETTQATDALRDLYADWSGHHRHHPNLTMRLFPASSTSGTSPPGNPKQSATRRTSSAASGIWAFPEGADRTKVLLYTHGGGFAVGSAASHRKLAGHVAKAVGVVTFVLDYRRAPEHPHPAQVEDGVAAFKALVDSGIHPHDITTVGDSAGGNLAIAIALALKEQGEPQPGQVIVFSPWLDMENKGETLITNDATDALISVPLLEGMIAGVLGDSVSPQNPLANPLHADFSGFPRLYITAGSVESLVDNATRLNALAEAAGVDVTLSIAEGQQHVYPFSAGNSEVADAELARIAGWYKY